MNYTFPKDTTSHAFPPVPIRGRYLAQNKLGKRARARLAADILNGRVKIDSLTVTQVARLCRVSVPYVYLVRGQATRESLAQHFARSTTDERCELARSAGVDRIWDELIQPLI